MGLLPGEHRVIGAVEQARKPVSVHRPQGFVKDTVTTRGVESCPSQIHFHPERQKGILFGNRVFAHVSSYDEVIPD